MSRSLPYIHQNYICAFSLAQKKHLKEFSILTVLAFSRRTSLTGFHPHLSTETVSVKGFLSTYLLLSLSLSQSLLGPLKASLKCPFLGT